MRVDLPDGQWAELRERLTHGQAKPIKRAYLRITADIVEAADLADVLIPAYVESWDVRNTDGSPATTSALDGIDHDTVDALTAACARAWRGASDPKGGA